MDQVRRCRGWEIVLTVLEVSTLQPLDKRLEIRWEILRKRSFLSLKYVTLIAITF
jgi:hypothetical protein